MRSEERLRGLLREAPVPGAVEAERRGLLVVAEAFAGRERRGRSPAPRLALVLASVLRARRALLSPAGASVRGWVGDVFTTATPPPAPALTDLPGGGRLLVQSEAGTWVVQADGSRRLLGRYEQASWSPHGLFVAAAAGHTLSAIEPDGTVHWTLSAPGAVSRPALVSVRRAHRLPQRRSAARRRRRRGRRPGRSRRVSRPSRRPGSAPACTTWPSSTPDGRLRVEDVDGRRRLGSAPALPGIETSGLVGRRLDPARSVPARPAGEAGETSKLAGEHPARRTARDPAAERGEPGGGGLLRPGDDDRRGASTERRRRPARAAKSPSSIRPGAPPQRLLSVPGDLASVLWSPDDSRLLIPWPGLDQWLFIPVRRSRPGACLRPDLAGVRPGSGGGGHRLPERRGLVLRYSRSCWAGVKKLW